MEPNPKQEEQEKRLEREKLGYTYYYGPLYCPGRPCTDGCDHYGVPPEEVSDTPNHERHSDLDTIDLDHDRGLRDLTDPFTGGYI